MAGWSRPLHLRRWPKVPRRHRGRESSSCLATQSSSRGRCWTANTSLRVAGWKKRNMRVLEQPMAGHASLWLSIVLRGVGRIYLYGYLRVRKVHQLRLKMTQISWQREGNKGATCSSGVIHQLGRRNHRISYANVYRIFLGERNVLKVLKLKLTVPRWFPRSRLPNYILKLLAQGKNVSTV